MRAPSVEEELRSRPEDPALWRCYSDWLREQGDARGTLIQLEQRLPATRPAERPAVEREIAGLVAEHSGDWDDGLPATAQVLTRRYGFATEVAVEWSDDLGEVVAQVLGSRFVATLRITPDSHYDDDEDDFVEEDDLWDGGPGPADRPGRLDMRVLAGLDLGRLAALDLGHLDLGPDGAEVLAGSLGTGRLRTLDLRYCRVGDAGLAALAASPHLNRLRRLHLQRNRLTAEGVRALHRFPELTELDLRYNEIGEAGADALLAAPFAGSLTRLWLYDTDVGRDGVRALAQSTVLPSGLRSVWRCL